MRDFIELLDRAVGHARFEITDRGTFTAAELRNIYHRNPGVLALARTRLQEDLVDDAVTLLQSLLHKHIVDDRVGNGLAFFLRGFAPLKVSDLALETVRASVILGPERVTRLLQRWENGQPIPFASHVILNGVSMEQALEPLDGIRLEAMPRSSNELAAQLPSTMHLHLSIMDMAGKAKMTVVNAAQSAVFRKKQPTVEEWDEVSGHHVYSSRSLDLLCEALSLVCNNCVTWRIAWSSCDVWDAFGQRDRAIVWHTSDPSHVPPTVLDEQSLCHALSLFIKWLNGEDRNAQIELAIDRWVRSKGDARISDQFIDLRIALEALYLKGINDELGFRLSNYGAWHLGTNFEERRQYRETLRRAYSRASSAIHAGTQDYTQEDRQLLADAQDLCRRGVLKRLDEKETPKWDELILGKEI